MWKLKNFSANQILGEIYFGRFRVFRNTILTISQTQNFGFDEFAQWLKFREFSVVKMMVLEMQNSLTLISREISLAEKLLIFHTASKKHFYYF